MIIFSASSVDDEGSPKEGNGNGYGNEDDDNSILWSAATGGGKETFCLLTDILSFYRHTSTVKNNEMCFGK